MPRAVLSRSGDAGGQPVPGTRRGSSAGQDRRTGRDLPEDRKGAATLSWAPGALPLRQPLQENRSFRLFGLFLSDWETDRASSVCPVLWGTWRWITRPGTPILPGFPQKTYARPCVQCSAWGAPETEGIDMEKGRHH